jgi:hypothetical protein
MQLSARLLKISEMDLKVLAQKTLARVRFPSFPVSLLSQSESDVSLFPLCAVRPSCGK